MVKLSAVVNTLNEADNIAACLDSLSWADQIVVVDMDSDDQTAEIARQHGAIVHRIDRGGYVEAARNFAIEQADGPWILIVDADERILSELAEKIRHTIDADVADVYYLAEKNLVFDQWIKHGLLWPDYHPRLFKKGHLRWSERIHDIPKPTGRTGHLEAKPELAIQHISKSYSSVNNFMRAYTGYSVYEAETLHKGEYRFRRRHLFLYPYREFKLRFFKAKGYRDGYHGLVLATLFAIYKAITIMEYWQRYTKHQSTDGTRTGWGYVIKVLRDKR